MSQLVLNGPVTFNGNVDGVATELESPDIALTLCFDSINGWYFELAGDLTTVAPQEPPVPESEDFNIIAGNESFYVKGYINGGAGSTDDTDVFNTTLEAVYSNSYTKEIAITVQGDHPQDLFDSIGISGQFSNGVSQKVFSTASATFSTVSGKTKWAWGAGDAYMVPGHSYNVVLTK